MDHTIKLARVCSDVSFDSLPGEVIHKAKLCVLDYIANIYGSLELDAVKAVVEYVEALGPKAATALGCGFRTGLQNAAFLNGTTAVAIERRRPSLGGIIRFRGAARCLRAGQSLKRGVRRWSSSGGADTIGRPARAAMHPCHTLCRAFCHRHLRTFGAAAARRSSGADDVGMQNAIGTPGTYCRLERSSSWAALP